MRYRVQSVTLPAAALLAIALCNVRLFADDSAMTGIGGGAVAPMASHPSVRMVSETVSIGLSDKGAKVHCEFAFKNEGSKRVVKMGFPENAWASGDGSCGRLSGFRSWVDGKPIKCVYKQGKLIKGKASSEQNCYSWYVKDVPFDPGQTRTIVDEYSTYLGSSSNSMMTDYETPKTFDYILKSGRNWKGPIGKAKIIVDTSRVTPEHYELSSSPGGFVTGGNSISWTFSNFEPTEDISIDLVPRYPELNGKMIGPDDWTPLDRKGGVTMTGLGFLRKLGARIEYPERHGAIVITYNGHTLRLVPGSKTGTLDGAKISLQAPPSTDAYPAQIPAALVVRALGGKAHYSQQDHRLHLSLKNVPSGR